MEDKNIVYLDNLPKFVCSKGVNLGKTCIDWSASVGYIVKFKYGSVFGEIEIIDYRESYLFVKYLDKPVYKIFTGSFMKASIKNLIKDFPPKVFKFQKGMIFKNRQALKIIDMKYQNKRKWYCYECLDCGFKGVIRETSIEKGTGCSCCSSRQSVLGINTIWDTDRWMVDLGISEEDAKMHTKCSDKFIKVCCPLCSRSKHMIISNIYKYKSICCVCQDGKSYPNKFMYSVLEQLKVDFETEKSFDWCYYATSDNNKKRGVYDFYFELGSNKYIVEMDGLQHFKETYYSKDMFIEGRRFSDIEKDRLAYSKGINVIRVDCRKSDLNYIKSNILDSCLSTILDLSDIDWEKAEMFSLTNLVKTVCDLKKDNPFIKLDRIKALTKLDKTTIISYLRKGAKLGWCIYNPREGKGKRIDIYKNNLLVGSFHSFILLEQNSKKSLGVKLLQSPACQACKKNTLYKGFTIKYKEES